MDRFSSRRYRGVLAALIAVAFVAVTNVARAQSELEPNDDAVDATFITTDGSLYGAVIDSALDNDWWAFSATSGNTYTITTSLLEGPDTWLDLYDSDGVTLLASDDDGGGGLASEIVWTATATDTLYFVVYDIGESGGGGYGVTVTETAGSVVDEIEPNDHTLPEPRSRPTARSTPLR